MANNPGKANKKTKKKASSWQHIYDAVKRIPRGHVVTYGQLARLLKVRGGARTVGFAMAGSPSGYGIPWHRVVGAGGRLLPHEPYASKQRMLLETEGAQFIGMKVDMSACQWRPSPRIFAKLLTKSPHRSQPNSRNFHPM